MSTTRGRHAYFYSRTAEQSTFVCRLDHQPRHAGLTPMQEAYVQMLWLGVAAGHQAAKAGAALQRMSREIAGAVVKAGER